MIAKLSNQTLDTLLNGTGVSPNNLSELLALVEIHNGRHSADSELLSNVGDFVDIDLVELCLRVCLAECINLWGYGAAWATPWGPAVQDNEVLGVEDLLEEVGLASMVVRNVLVLGPIRGGMLTS